MIVTCEQCQTRFKLDAARIPETGARVRCSRCKHAFFVVKPGAAARDAAVHAVAGEAATSERAPAPAATQDLGTLDGAPPFGNTSATRLMPPLAAPAAERTQEAATTADSESDWQFNEPLRDGATTQTREPRRPVARRTAPPPPEDDATLDGLGSPDSWDILGDAALPPLESVTPAAPAKASETPARTSDAPRAGAAAPKLAETSSEAGASTRAAARAGWRETPRDVAFFAGVWLWIAVVAAVSVAPHTPAARGGAVAPTLPGVALDGLRGRFLENAVAGPVFVVSGELRPSDPAAPVGRLEVVLVGPSGEVGRAPLGDAPAEVRLREAAPEALEREIAGSALARGTRTLASGQALRVAALVPGAPRDVTGFRVEAAGAPAP